MPAPFRPCVRSGSERAVTDAYHTPCSLMPPFFTKKMDNVELTAGHDTETRGTYPTRQPKIASGEPLSEGPCLFLLNTSPTSPNTARSASSVLSVATTRRTAVRRQTPRHSNAKSQEGADT